MWPSKRVVGGRCKWGRGCSGPYDYIVCKTGLMCGSPQITLAVTNIYVPGACELNFRVPGLIERSTR